MPLKTGLELLKKVKELNPNVRTMLVSAFDMQDNPSKIFERWGYRLIP